MKKDAILKWQLFIGIIIAYLMIIGTAFYFFTTLERNVKLVKVNSDRIQSKFSILIEVDDKLARALQAKNQYLFKQSEEDLHEINTLREENIKAFANLKAGYPDDAPILKDIEALEKASSENLNLVDIAKQRTHSFEEIKEMLIQEQIQTNQMSAAIRSALSKERETIAPQFNISLHSLKTISYSLIGIALLSILFIINRIIKIVRELNKRSKEANLLNQEIEQAKNSIEEHNWILAEASKLQENISGIDSDELIAKKAFDSVLKSLDFYAGAIYIKDKDTSEFFLRHQIGVDKNNNLPSRFIEGEGLMGHVAHTMETKIIHQDNETTLNSSSALHSNHIRTIIIAPLVYEKQTLGILEIGGNYTEKALQRKLKYIDRISKTLAISIKFGQSHMQVENLLEESQQQAEELEAQQEELRITNEELIYKTNLLEASEEELRVQQEELQQTNAELEEKATELTLRNNELNTTRKTVEEKIKEVELASKYKSEFMANMSHELRTPLNSILILAKLLHDNKGKNLNADQVKYASVIHSAGSDLLQLINELLDLAKIEAGKVDLNKEVIHTNQFSKNLENLFIATAQQKEIEFYIIVDDQVPDKFVSDEYRLEQVLKNFLSNAFKFTPKKGKVTLNITADEDNLKFIVSDTGKGISEEKQQLIFEAFKQEDGSTSRKYGGTGLGLSISREIASLLGGRITLKSESEKGSIFSLILPYERASEQMTIQEHIPLATIDAEKKTYAKTNTIEKDKEEELLPEPTISEEKSLLIIEDDFNFADILREFAETYNFRAMLAHDGKDGIQKAIQFKPQAIILDVMLPISDGWEVLRTLKASPETKHIPVHMMSAANYNQREFIEKGAIGFLSKPVTENALKKVFENIHLNIDKGIKNVLLVEDQEFQSEVIKSAFAEQHINIIQAFSAKSALAKLEEEKSIDCVILDVKLPDADGLETLDKIKAMPHYVDTPIIINTAYDLSKEQIAHINQYTKALVLKSEKSNNRLIDEVTLFLNKISSADYSPVKNVDKLKNSPKQKDILNGKKVLIADDDMRNVFALTTSLEQYDMDIEIANNGLEAVDAVNNNPGKIDIVLMDIMMPEMDGHEAIEKIRQKKEYANLPIIAVTAKAMKEDRDKSIKIGASDYISKPIDIDKLLSLMRVWLS